MILYYPPSLNIWLSKGYFSYRFQGHYINRYKNVAHQCHCLGVEKRRTFLTFSKPSRKREYCGRQLVGYTMDQMFEVVSDVGNYQKFVPWCKQSKILYKTPGYLQADLIVGFPPINESYVSNVTLIKPHLVKAESSQSKLFYQLLSLWRFSPGLKREQQSCVVDFQVIFEFRSALHLHLTNIFFDQVVHQMERAFLKEVCRRHGPPSMQPKNLLLNDNTKS